MARATIVPTASRLAAQIDVAARDARDVQQVVDQPREVLHLPLDHVARPGELRIGQRAPAHDLDRVADRRERIAQLVREHGEELVLVPVGFLQRRFDARALAPSRSAGR